MSDTALPAPESQTPHFKSASARSLPARLITFFSGTNGLIAKLVLLGGFNALVVWAATILATHHKWIALLIVAIAAGAIDALYLIPSQRTLPLKFLLPGTVFLVGFTLIPIIYTINIAFTNYSTGHILAKNEAIEQIKLRSLSQPPNGKTYTLSPALDANGKLTLLLVDDKTHQPYVGTKEGLTALEPSNVTMSSGAITKATGYKVLTGSALFSLDRQLDEFRVPLSGGSAIHPEGADFAVQLTPDKHYDPKTDTFTGRSGVVYRDNGEGSFAPTHGEALQPGWKTYNGFKQFSNIVTNPTYRAPFLRVLLWTLVFAASTVIFSFALGLLFAVTLQKKFRGQRAYRTLLIIPYAVPSFLTILVWAGLLDQQYGIVNKIFPFNIDWLFDPWWARVSVILVSLWLTFPYFFLVCLGALQSIPGDLVEAAKVDGAGGWQVFRRITMPLLLVSTAPLLIASFAFNFNNFNNIYLLTGGGPSTNDQSVAGSTDILISYTYKLAFSSGQGQQYSTAAAISIIIFVIVGTISGLLFWRTKALETLR
jgi:arabinogalactan oligomer/maltooligosaccharide transport system permease protein